MDNKIDFEKIETSIIELKKSDSVEKKVDKLLELISLNNTNSKILFESYLETSNSNKRIFETLNEALKSIIERVNNIEEWTNAQQGLNENLTDKFIDNHNSIQDILKTIDFINESSKSMNDIIDIFDKRFEIMQERIELL